MREREGEHRESDRQGLEMGRRRKIEGGRGREREKGEAASSFCPFHSAPPPLKPASRLSTSRVFLPSSLVLTNPPTQTLHSFLLHIPNSSPSFPSTTSTFLRAAISAPSPNAQSISVLLASEISLRGDRFRQEIEECWKLSSRFRALQLPVRGRLVLNGPVLVRPQDLLKAMLRFHLRPQ